MKQISTYITLVCMTVMVMSTLSLSANDGDNGKIKVEGVIMDYSSMNKLDACKIQILKQGEPLSIETAGGNGKFAFTLPLSFSYDLLFQREGYFTKIIRLDTRNIPLDEQVGGFELEMDISLLEKNDCFQEAIFADPYGLATYDTYTKEIVFDFPRTDKMKAKVEDELERCKGLKERQAGLQKEFDKLLKEGDALVAENSFEVGISKYEAAQKLFPTNTLPPQKISEARAKWEIWKNKDAENANYVATIKAGDDLKKTNKLQEAKEKYQQAAQMKPSEALPKDKLKEIDDLLAKAGKQAQYDALISKADGEFGSANYTAAINTYEEALRLLSDKEYPKDQIAKAKKAIADLKSNAEAKDKNQERFEEMMALGDKNADKKNYETAYNNYKEANQLNPSAPEPIAKMADMQARMRPQEETASAAPDTTGNFQKKLDKEYLLLIQTADKHFSGKKLNDAKDVYEKALVLKPQEKYPQSRLKMIDDMLAQAAKAAQTPAPRAPSQKVMSESDREYALREERANTLFSQGSYEQARDAYIYALEIKPSAAFSRQRIQEIDILLMQQRFDEKMTTASAKSSSIKEKRAADKAEFERKMDELAQQSKAESTARTEEMDEMRSAKMSAPRATSSPDPLMRTPSTVNVEQERATEERYRQALKEEEKNKYERVNEDKAKAAAYQEKLQRQADEQRKQNEAKAAEEKKLLNAPKR